MAAVVASTLGLSGCATDCGPQLGLWAYPIPVSPYFQWQLEECHKNKERYERVAILGPTTAGGPPQALDPPTPAEVMAALNGANGVAGGLPFLDEVQQNNVRVTVELIADYMDPPRKYPLIGVAQLHHAHYKCTIFYTEVTRVGWPIPHTLTDEEHSEVIYIDHNHFHMVAGDGGPGTNYAQPPQ